MWIFNIWPNKEDGEEQESWSPLDWFSFWGQGNKYEEEDEGSSYDIYDKDFPGWWLSPPEVKFTQSSGNKGALSGYLADIAPKAAYKVLCLSATHSPQLASGIFNSSLGFAIGGPVGGITAAAASGIDFTFGTENHPMARFVAWNNFLLSAASGPASWASVGVSALASRLLTKYTKDFLDFDERIEDIRDSFQFLSQVYSHNKKDKGTSADVGYKLPLIIHNLLYQQGLTTAKIGLDYGMVKALGNYFAGDFIITFFQDFGKSDEAPDYWNASYDIGKVFGIMALYQVLQLYIANKQVAARREMSDDIKRACLDFTSDKDVVAQILSTEGGKDQLSGISYAIEARANFAASNVSAILEAKADQIMAMTLLLDSAPMLVMLKILTSQFSNAVEKFIREKDKELEDIKDTFEKKSTQIEHSARTNITDVMCDGSEGFVKDLRLDIIRNSAEINAKSTVIQNQKALYLKVISQLDSLLNLAGYGYYILTSQVSLAQVPMLLSKGESAQLCFANLHGGVNVIYGNKEQFEAAMKAAQNPFNTSLQIIEDEGGNFGISNYKLHIKEKLCISIEDAEFHPGDHVAIVATSGAGKSTMLQSFKGLFAAEGTLRIPSAAEGKTPMSLVTQDVFLIPKISLFENIMGKLKAQMTEDEVLVAKAKICDIFSKISLNTKEPIATLLEKDEHDWASGGQRKKIALVKSVMQNPSLLILDETFTGIDQDTLKKVYATLAEYLPDAIILSIDHYATFDKTFYNLHLDVNNLPATLHEVSSLGETEQGPDV